MVQQNTLFYTTYNTRYVRWTKIMQLDFWNWLKNIKVTLTKVLAQYMVDILIV
jgi:hypothetical protein